MASPIASERAILALCNSRQFDEAFRVAQSFPKEYSRHYYVAEVIYHYVLSDNWDFEKVMNYAIQIPIRESNPLFATLRENTFGSIAIAIVAQERFSWIQLFDAKQTGIRFDSEVSGHSGSADLHQALAQHISKYLREGRTDIARTIIDHLRGTTANVEKLEAMLRKA